MHARAATSAIIGLALMMLSTAALGAASLASLMPGTRPTLPADSQAPPDPILGDSVASIVNTDPITDYDLRQRVDLYIATAGVQRTPEVEKKIRAQILDQLITEKLEIQEAKRKNISISSPEVDKALGHILTDNHITMDQLKEMLGRQGVSVSTLRNQIAAQVIWQKVVEDEFQDRINITDAEIDAELVRLSEGKDKPHFLVSEIFLAVDTPDQDPKVQKNIGDLEQQLQSGAPFQVLARQFSQSPSAASGGDIGWVYQGQLASELNAALTKMQAGQVSQPIRSTGGYYILAVRERQEPSNTKLPDPAQLAPQGPQDKLPLARLLLPLGANPQPKVADAALKFAQEVVERVGACGQLENIARKVKGQYQNMGDFRVKDLAEPLQQALAKSQPGQAIPPFRDAAGVEVIFRCDKAIPKLEAYHVPSRKEIEEQLFDQQVTAFARRYMRDLRRQADVEIR